MVTYTLTFEQFKASLSKTATVALLNFGAVDKTGQCRNAMEIYLPVSYKHNVLYKSGKSVWLEQLKSIHESLQLFIAKYDDESFNSALLTIDAEAVNFLASLYESEIERGAAK